MQKVSSYQIADSIDLKNFKTVFPARLQYADTDELFFITPAEEYIHVFRYGIVSFFNYEDKKMEEFIRLIEPYCKNLLHERLNDEFEIQTNAPKLKVGYNKIELPSLDNNVLRFVMLNVSQSVALDHYSKLTTTLLEETNSHTQELERKGSLNLSGLNLKKYIGRTLNIKNRISETLYILDSPEETWEDEKLNRLDLELKKTFDLQVRFRNIQESLGIVKENLDLFKDMLQYRNSTRLEWVVILLILVEVLNLLFEKIFK